MELRAHVFDLASSPAIFATGALDRIRTIASSRSNGGMSPMLLQNSDGSSHRIFVDLILKGSKPLEASANALCRS
jgi:hypothetical protein